MKIISILLFATNVTIILNPLGYLLLSVIVLAAIWEAGFSAGCVVANFRPFLFLALLTFLLHLIFSSSKGQVIIAFGGISITNSALRAGALFAWRILLFFSLALLLTLATDPVDLSDSLVKLLKPLRRLGFPIDHLGLLIFLSLRLIPLLAEEFRAISIAQISRGFGFQGGLIKRIKNLPPLLTAVIAASLRRASNLALAMETRGFLPERRRSSFRIFKIRFRDLMALAMAIVISLASILVSMHA